MNQPRVWIEADKSHYPVTSQMWASRSASRVGYIREDNITETGTYLENGRNVHGDVLELSTEQNDRNGKEIFEGDRVRYNDNGGIFEANVYQIYDGGFNPFNIYLHKDCEVIGHIHEGK